MLSRTLFPYLGFIVVGCMGFWSFFFREMFLYTWKVAKQWKIEIT
jgi:hypothetical protein